MVRLSAPFIFQFWKNHESCNLGSYRKVHLQTLHASEMLLLFRKLINKYDFDPNLKKVYLCQDKHLKLKKREQLSSTSGIGKSQKTPEWANK